MPTASLSVACCISHSPALGAPRLVEIVDWVYDSFEGRCVRGIALSEPMILKHVDLGLRAQVINRLITCRLLMLRLPLIKVLVLVLMVLKVLLLLMLLSGTGGEQVARRPVLLIKVVSLGLEVSVLQLCIDCVVGLLYDTGML